MALDRDIARNIVLTGGNLPVFIKFLACDERLFVEKIFIEFKEEKYDVDYEVRVGTSGSVKLNKSSISSGYYAYGIHLI